MSFFLSLYIYILIIPTERSDSVFQQTFTIDFVINASYYKYIITPRSIQTY